MSRRDEILRELGITPVWRLRAAPAVEGAAPAGVAVVERPVPIASEPAPGPVPQAGLHYVTLWLADAMTAEQFVSFEGLAERERKASVERALDAGAGACAFDAPRAASAARRVLRREEGEGYRLQHWVVMPNHLHVVLELLEGARLDAVLRELREAITAEVGRATGDRHLAWDPRSLQHAIAGSDELRRFRDYVLRNPVRCGLADAPAAWPWSSAWVEDDEPGIPGELTGGTPVGEFPEPVASADPAAGVAGMFESAAQRRERILAMDWAALKACVADCTACPLAKGRKHTVFGVGDENANWLFVGEGPGAEEDAKGEPFVGQAGKLLDNMLAAIGMKRGVNVYIANVVKCRPPNNRNPEAGEAAACEPYLTRQIDLIQPKLIVALGKVAANHLLSGTATIASMRGRVHRYHGIPLVVTYHPAYLLRTLTDKSKAWTDLLFAVKTMEAGTEQGG